MTETLDEYTYSYDRAGNRTSRANELHSSFDEDYLYDALNRLTDSDRADAFDQSWTLDGLGNFATFDDDGNSQTRTANAVNEITNITGGWITPSYDAAGNMISGPRPGDETTSVHYVLDAWNRLVEVRADDSGEPGDLIAEYEYDGANRRINKTFADDMGVEHFYNHDWQMLEERAVDDEGTPTAVNQYVWSARYVDAPVLRFHDANADGDLFDVGDTTYYYTGDANFNVTATIDAGTGEVVERYVYTAYGEATVYDEDWANPRAPATDGPLYCGYFFDAETGLYQVRNRYYDSSVSAFISRDPIGYWAKDANLYRYVANRPLGLLDPSGTIDGGGGGEPPGWCGKPNCGPGDEPPGGIWGPNPNTPPPPGPYTPTGAGAAACNGYNKYIGSTCTRCGKTVTDPYPAKAKTVCNNFMDLYQESEEAICVANGLTGMEGAIIANVSGCGDRNKFRLNAHIWCYAMCGFGAPKGMPDGAAEVGWKMLFWDWLWEWGFLPGGGEGTPYSP